MFSIFSLFIALVFSMILNVEDDFVAKEITIGTNENWKITKNIIPFGLKTEKNITINKKQNVLNSCKKTSVSPIFVLVVFILVITINSGLMYRVLIPSFSHLKSFTGWYWAFPYIIVIFIIRNLSGKIKRSYIIYTAISMMGLSFIAFYLLEKSAVEYLIINTLMLGAFGIIDIFWWSTLGEMIEFYENPVTVFGIGLSANVSGVIIGGFIGEIISSYGELSDLKTMMIALSVIFVTILIFHRVNRYLSSVVGDYI